MPYCLGTPALSLWNGCIWAYICQEMYTFFHGWFPLNQRIWKDGLYCVEGNSGDLASVYFEDRHTLVGNLFYHESNRNPLPHGRRIRRVLLLPEAISPGLRSAWREHVSPRMNIAGIDVSTAVLWSEYGMLYSVDSRRTFMKHGGCVLDREFMQFKRSLIVWKNEFELSELAINVATDLYNARLNSKTSHEVHVVISDHVTRSADPVVLQRFEHLQGAMKSIGIMVT